MIIAHWVCSWYLGAASTHQCPPPRAQAAHFLSFPQFVEWTATCASDAGKNCSFCYAIRIFCLRILKDLSSILHPLISEFSWWTIPIHVLRRLRELRFLVIFCCSNFSNGEDATWKLVKMVRDETVLLKISFMFNGQIFMPASADTQQMKHSWYLAISFFLFSSGDFSFVCVFGC
jgi:hypothetical protein